MIELKLHNVGHIIEINNKCNRKKGGYFHFFLHTITQRMEEK